MAAMRVLQMENLPLQKRIRRNFSELLKLLEPVQLFNDLYPVFHSMDRMTLMRAVERDIPPMAIHKIWEALQRRHGWEEHFVKAVRSQDNPYLLQILGIPDENVLKDGRLCRDQQTPDMRGVAEGHFRENQQHSFQYPQFGQAPASYSSHQSDTSQAAVFSGHHYGLEQGFRPVQPQFYYSGHDQLDTKENREDLKQLNSNTRGNRPDISPHVLGDQRQKMQQIQNTSERQGVTKRDLVNNFTACLQTQSTDLATHGGQRQHTASRLTRPQFSLPGFQDQSRDRYSGDNVALPFTTNCSSYAQNALAALSASSAISDAAGHQAMFSPPPNSLEHPARGETSYNIRESLVDNSAYSCTVEIPDRPGYKTPTLPLDTSESRESNVDKETLTSTGFTATPAEGLPDLKEDSGELYLDAGNSDVYPEQTDVLAVADSVTSTQTGEADEPRPPLERETPQTHFHFGNVGNLQLVIRETGVTVIGADNSINMLPHVAQTLNTGEEERAARQEESGENEHERSFQETEREPSDVPEEAVSPSPQSPVSRPVEETEHESQVASSLSESVCLSTNPFSSADFPQLMNLKTPNDDIIRQEVSMPQTSPGEECPGILSSQTRWSNSGVSNPESLHLAWDDPRHETFVKGAVHSGGSDQQGVTPQTTTHSPRQHSHVTNTTPLTATKNTAADHRVRGLVLYETTGDETNDSDKESTVQKYINIRKTKTATPIADTVAIQSVHPTTLDDAHTSPKIKADQNNSDPQTELRPLPDPIRQDYSLASSDLVEDAVSGMAPPQGPDSVETFLEARHFCGDSLQSGAGSEDITGKTRLLDGVCSQTDDGACEGGAFKRCSVALKRRSKNVKDKSDRKSILRRSKRQKNTKGKANQCCHLQ